MLVLATSLLGAACGTGAPADNINEGGAEVEPSKGCVLYLAHCVTCHGKDGRLGMSGAKPLPDTKLAHAEIVERITHGKGMMNPFEGILSPAEIDSVAVYVGTLKAVH